MKILMIWLRLWKGDSCLVIKSAKVSHENTFSEMGSLLLAILPLVLAENNVCLHKAGVDELGFDKHGYSEDVTCPESPTSYAGIIRWVQCFQFGNSHFQLADHSKHRSLPKSLWLWVYDWFRFGWTVCGDRIHLSENAHWKQVHQRLCSNQGKGFLSYFNEVTVKSVCTLPKVENFASNRSYMWFNYSSALQAKSRVSSHRHFQIWCRFENLWRLQGKSL